MSEETAVQEEPRKFTVEEFRNYLLDQDSIGDALYFLNEGKIDESNVKLDDEDDEFLSSFTQ